MPFLSSNTAPAGYVEQSASSLMSLTLNCSSPVTMTVNTAAHFTITVSPQLPQTADQAHDQPSQDSTTARPMTPASVTESAEEVTTSAASAMPDYMLDPNAVCKDVASWRYGKAPDYSNTRRVYAETKTQDHEIGSLPNLVENLVKNWEIEASFKTSAKDYRTVHSSHYKFFVNGKETQAHKTMTEVGTYNALIAPNEYYSPDHCPFEQSHKLFKRVMPTFAWEVVEVYSGPPRVAFKWRHWGEMKGDYHGTNMHGDSVTIKAHGGAVELYGLTVAELDEQYKIMRLDTWFDPVSLFREYACPATKGGLY